MYLWPLYNSHTLDIVWIMSIKYKWKSNFDDCVPSDSKNRIWLELKLFDHALYQRSKPWQGWPHDLSEESCNYSHQEILKYSFLVWISLTRNPWVHIHRRDCNHWRIMHFPFQVFTWNSKSLFLRHPGRSFSFHIASCNPSFHSFKKLSIWYELNLNLVFMASLHLSHAGHNMDNEH